MNRLKLYCLSLTLMVFIQSCIGTDIVDDVIVPEELNIVTGVDSLRIGDSFQFVADYFDSLGQKQDVPLEWLSTDNSILSIATDGTATAIAMGDVFVKASFGAASDSLMVNSGDMTSEMVTERSGNFMGRSDYNVEGLFTLSDKGDRLELEFDNSFRASNGPGLFVYLSNEITRVTGGLELGPLQSNSGGQIYTIDKADAQLDTYTFVLIYCKPFGVTFGYGEFEN